MATILIGSKLPNGLILKHPAKPSLTVTLRGTNAVHPVIAPYVTTEVDQDFWDAWYLAHSGAKPFPALTSGAIFVAKTAEAAAKIMKETAKQKTGLEPMAQTSKDIKPASDKD